jgi:hypothetical protein
MTWNPGFLVPIERIRGRCARCICIMTADSTAAHVPDTKCGKALWGIMRSELDRIAPMTSAEIAWHMHIRRSPALDNLLVEINFILYHCLYPRPKISANVGPPFDQEPRGSGRYQSQDRQRERTRDQTTTEASPSPPRGEDLARYASGLDVETVLICLCIRRSTYTGTAGPKVRTHPAQ